MDGAHKVKLIAAIDPGSSGGFAWVNEAGYVETCGTGQRRAFIEYLRESRKNWSYESRDMPVVYMEKVAGYYPKPKLSAPGEKPEFNLQSSAFSMFNFGKSAGICLGICEAFGIVPVEVMPAAWQKITFMKKSGSRQQWKNALKEVAQRRFPDVKVTLANADALLLLSYGMLMTRGEIDIAPESKQ